MSGNVVEKTMDNKICLTLFLFNNSILDFSQLLFHINLKNKGVSITQAPKILENRSHFFPLLDQDHVTHISSSHTYIIHLTP